MRCARARLVWSLFFLFIGHDRRPRRACDCVAFEFRPDWLRRESHRASGLNTARVDRYSRNDRGEVHDVGSMDAEKPARVEASRG